MSFYQAEHVGHALNLSSGVGLALKISLKDGHVVYEKHDISITCVCNF